MKRLKKIFMSIFVISIITGNGYSQEIKMSTKADIQTIQSVKIQNLQSDLTPETDAEQTITPKKEKDLSNHEIYIGYGFPGSLGPIMLSGLENLIVLIFTGGTHETKIKQYGTAQVGYDWHCIPGKGLLVGGIITVEPFTTTAQSTSTNTEGSIVEAVLLSLQASVKYQYGWEYVRLYHGLSAGLGLVFSDNSSVSPTFIMNIIPIGVKVGKEKYPCFFADIGLGSTAIVNAGISYRF